MSVEPAMSLKDVKNRLSEVVCQVEREHARVTITKHGPPAAVVISTDDLASLEETLVIMGRRLPMTMTPRGVRGRSSWTSPRHLS